eukprot:CAMPEP_0197057990 /NCGR_PEP_ID=MMETSP1384-20130603/102879_1 /TAXON_ID=29189 /ORGANISM="Ammonia sp." /LENGTH=51 /DNA_ID=CAMNT_0042492589 /DNA_START=12 /DNA_END=163 /DNA_ORIENTATION=-
MMEAAEKEKKKQAKELAIGGAPSPESDGTDAHSPYPDLDVLTPNIVVSPNS